MAASAAWPGLLKALEKARRLVYVEDQYLWGHHVGDVFTDALRRDPGLHVIAVADVPRPGRRVPATAAARSSPGDDRDDGGRPGAVYDCLENHAGTPVYVHAKACVVDDAWASVGSDNFNRRSWCDSELSAVVVDRTTHRDDGGGLHGAYPLRLRLALGAEHLDRPFDPEVDAGDDASLRRVMADCVDPLGMYETFAATARASTRGTRAGAEGPAAGPDPVAGHPGSGRSHGRWRPPYLVLHDPVGRPAAAQAGRLLARALVAPRAGAQRSRIAVTPWPPAAQIEITPAAPSASSLASVATIRHRWRRTGAPRQARSRRR